VLFKDFDFMIFKLKTTTKQMFFELNLRDKKPKMIGAAAYLNSDCRSLAIFYLIVKRLRMLPLWPTITTTIGRCTFMLSLKFAASVRKPSFVLNSSYDWH